MRREIELAQSADRQAKEAVAIITEEQRAQAANEVFITGQKIVAVAKAMVERSRDLSLPYRERKLAHDIVKGFYGVAKDVVGASQSIGGAADGYGVSLSAPVLQLACDRVSAIPLPPVFAWSGAKSKAATPERSVGGLFRVLLFAALQALRLGRPFSHSENVAP